MKNFYILLITLISFNLVAQELILEDIKKQVEVMEKKYGVKFHIDTMPKTTWAIKYEFAQIQDYENLYNYLNLFDKAFGKYPSSLLNKSKLKDVVFVKSLKYNVNNNEQVTPIVPDYQKKMLIYDFIIGNYDKTYQEHTIHLAFYQILDNRINRNSNQDSIWNSFNSSNNVYGPQGIYANNQPLSYGLDHSINGFISSYSLTSIKQDKAEIFAGIYTEKEYDKIELWIKEDKVLFNKVTYLKNILEKINKKFDRKEITINDINKFILLMEKKYQIKFYINSMPQTTWNIDYEFAQKDDYEDLYNYLKLFDKEFNKYPLSFLKKSKLQGIAFVKDLSIELDNKILQERGAIPDYKNELLIYDYMNGNHNKAYQQHVVHHEFYHMLEEEINGNARWKDPEWNSLNIENNIYGKGGKYYRGTTQSIINHPKTGVISLYSLSALEEDKAEIYASLFTKSDSIKLNQWVKEDKVLNNKVEYMKSFLKGVDPSFTTNYWNEIRN